jgi:hypothetical protein
VKVRIFKRYPVKFVQWLHNRLMDSGKRFSVYSEDGHRECTIKWEE